MQAFQMGQVTVYMYMYYLDAFYTLEHGKPLNICAMFGLFQKMNLSSLYPIFDYNVHNNPLYE